MPRFGKSFVIRPVNLTSGVATLIFAMIYGVIEHTLLTSQLGVSIFEYPLNLQLVGQIYFHHVLMLSLAGLICFNPFLDVFFFSANKSLRKQGFLWGTGNILNFVWLEDMFYFILFAEWPKDVMTPLHLSFYGIVWWYPLLFAGASVLYYLTIREIRKSGKQLNNYHK